jgi:RHS repeat-associated protein
MRTQLTMNIEQVKSEKLKTKNRVRRGKKYISLLVSFSFFIFQSAKAQVTPSNNLPWVKVQTAKVATTNPDDLNDPEKGRTVIQYLDGYQRPLQTVNYAATPLGRDIISGVGTLDVIGRADKSYLPVPSVSASGQYYTNVETAAQGFYNDSKPYSKIAEYEASPMSRVLKSFGPGEAFQNITSQGTQQNFEVAGAGIRKYVITDENTITGTSTYSNGQLIRTWAKDEDGNESIEYRGSKSGRLIQKQQKSKTSSELLITAYVYDFMGRLRFVITPKLYNAATTITVSSHSEGLYIFHYDDRSRLVETRKPGSAAEYTVFNELGQAVMTQNGRDRETNTWLWVKYDGHGRTVMNGTLTSSLTREQIQSHFDWYSAPEHFEEPSTAGGAILGYTNRSFPTELSITESNVKAVNYYDGYAWVNDVSLSFQLYENHRWNYSDGLPTGSMVRRLDTGAWMKTVLYYDDQNRLIQSQTKNRFGSVNRTDIVMDFEGKISENRTIYRRPGHADLTVSTLYAYDDGGRQTSVKHKVNGTETSLAKYGYDEIGRLVRKYLGVADGEDIIIENSPQPNGDQDIAFRYVELQPGTISAENGTYLAAIAPGPLQTIDYSYTIRGQLRGINLNASGDIDLSGGKVFGLKLDHHETGQTYNGKLNKQTWKSRSQELRSFTYGYDSFDRIGSATYSGVGAEDYGMPGIDYDANGNLAAFNRKGLASAGNWQSIDILSYNYQNAVSNKLSYIVDYGNPNVGFKDNGGFGSDYTYYPDGSLKSDANKGITLIEYNYLSLPEKIHFGSSKRIENNYDAEGVKLEQRLINGGITHTTEYIGDLIYVNGVLQTIQHDEGRVKVEGSQNRYQFFISDHLGSTRIIIERVSDTAALVQELHYGIWGEKLEGIGVDGDWNFLFQAKEYIDFEGYNTYDFHARQYDPWTGRFNSIDPKNQFSSGYLGMGNRPTFAIDPDGQWVNFLIGAVMGGISGWQMGKAQGAKGWGMVGYIAGGAGIGLVTAGVGSYVQGAFKVSTWGGHIAAYGASGAASGFVGGGLNSTLSGGNFWQGAGRGALYGGVGGLATGAVVGGIDYFSRVGEARRSLMAAGVDPKSSITATDAGLHDFVQNNPTLSDLYGQAGNPKMSVATAENIPSKYSLNTDGLLVTPDGHLAGGIASPIYRTRDLVTGSIKSEILIAPKQFSKALKLYMTAGHELIHARDFYVGNFTRWHNTFAESNYANEANLFSGYRSEVNAHSWSYNTARIAGYNTSHYKNMVKYYRNLLPIIPK